MKKILLLAFMVMTLCGNSQTKTDKESNKKEFLIVNTPILIEKDTAYVNQLRFYKINSALDGMMLMYRNYGEWNKKSNSLHQSNIKRLIWKEVKLLDNSDETFLVIADGTETMKDYYACLMVFDSNDRDCLDESHPLNQKIMNNLVQKMRKLDRKKSLYKKFRS